MICQSVRSELQYMCLYIWDLNPPPSPQQEKKVDAGTDFLLSFFCVGKTRTTPWPARSGAPFSGGGGWGRGQCQNRPFFRMGGERVVRSKSRQNPAGQCYLGRLSLGPKNVFRQSRKKSKNFVPVNRPLLSFHLTDPPETPSPLQDPHWTLTGPPSAGPPFRTLVPADLARWTDNRQAELREACGPRDSHKMTTEKAQRIGVVDGHEKSPRERRKE